MRRGLALVGVFVVLLVLPASAHAVRDFTLRESFDEQGDIAIVSNSLLTCIDDQSSSCANARSAASGATDLNNNDRTMTWIDADGFVDINGDDVDDTDNSSSADLDLPAGATVEWAGLYWGGKETRGTGGSSWQKPTTRQQVLFKAPGDTAYDPLTAPAPVDEASTQYQGFVNVTETVEDAGEGTYWVANVRLGTGKNDAQSGGWALVVIYGDPDAPNRNLSVFDGFRNVGSGSTVEIPLSGFQTPLSGDVNSAIGLVAYEGDLGTNGDGAALQGPTGSFTALSNAVNPGSNTVASANNVFNATISNAGALVTSRTPSFRNNFGYDADLFRTTNLLGNDQTSTRVRLSTSGDAYQPGVVTLATDLYAPRIMATKSVDLAAANLGDTLTYTVEVENTGQDDANGTTFSDPLPTGTVFVPGSITINGTPVSDAAGDDLGEFAGGRVVARLGTLETAGAGASATVSFQVTVATAGLAPGATIENTADLAFTAATTGKASTVTTAPAVTNVLVPDLAIGKSHAPALSPGQSSTYTITVGNVGDGPTAGTVTVTDTIEPPGLTINGAVTGEGWACTVAAATITCTRSDPLPAGSEYPPISIPVLVSPGAQPGSLSNTASLAAPSDGNPDNNSFTDAGAVSEPAIDLHVEKTVTSTPQFTPEGYVPADFITYRIEVTNNGVADAANVQLVDTLESPLVFLGIGGFGTPSQGTCDTLPDGLSCNFGTIAPGGPPATVEITARLPFFQEAPYPSNRLLGNTATVSAPVGNEINPDDNSATVTIPTLPIADITLDKTFSPAQPAAGGPITYTVTVRNLGPDTVDVSMSDLLPQACEVFDCRPLFVLPPSSVSISGGTGVCEFDPTGRSPFFPRPAIFCDIPQFAPGEERIITYQSTLAPDSAGTEVSNFAFAGGLIPGTTTSWDVDLGNDDNFEITTFTPGTVDTAIEKTRIGTGPVAVGGEAAFQLGVSNNGDVPATDVVARDTLPAGLSALAPPPGCAIQGQDVVCRIDSLPAGETRNFEIRARAEAGAAGQTLTNRATVASSVGSADGDSSDNQASADVTVSPLPPPPSADVAVDVRAPSGPATVGEPGTWEIEVVNNGPISAAAVNLSARRSGARADTVGAQVAQSGCQTGGGAINCSLGDLAADERRSVEVRLRPREAERLRLFAEVTTSTSDSVAENNTDADSIRPRRATVAIDVDTSKRRLDRGEPMGVVTEISTNGRPANNVRVCVRLPQALALSRKGGARVRNGRACWRTNRIAANRSRRYRLRVRAVGVTRPRRVTLTATVTGAGVRTRRSSVRVLILPAQARPAPPVTG